MPWRWKRRNRKSAARLAAATTTIRIRWLLTSVKERSSPPFTAGGTFRYSPPAAASSEFCRKAERPSVSTRKSGPGGSSPEAFLQRRDQQRIDREFPSTKTTAVASTRPTAGGRPRTTMATKSA